MQLSPFQDSPAQLDRRDLWLRIGESATYAAFIVILSWTLSFLYSFYFIELLVLIPGLAVSIIFPHWHFRQQAQLKNCLWLSACYIGITLLVDFMLTSYLGKYDYLMMLNFLIGLALSIVLPHFLFKKWFYSFEILITWFTVMTLVLLSLSST